MKESQTQAEQSDPALKAAGRDVASAGAIRLEYHPSASSNGLARSLRRIAIVSGTIAAILLLVQVAPFAANALARRFAKSDGKRTLLRAAGGDAL